MKRFLLIIGAILLSLALRAQSVTYTCCYWFDQNFGQAVTTTFSESTWQAELDVGSLAEGLHALHLQVMDTSMKWSAPQSYLFLKLPEIQAADVAYHFWFDQDFAHRQSSILGNGHLLLDVDALSSGLHSLHLVMEGSAYSATQSYLFLKTDPATQGDDSFVYHCWFDQDFEHQQTDALGTGHFLLDVSDLEEGMHTVHVIVEGTQQTATQSYLFMKAAQFTMDDVDMSHLAYHCWFDHDFEHQQNDSLGNGHILLDVNDLEDGMHIVHVMLEGSTLTTSQSYMFMKVAVQDSSHEMQYVCWFDQDYDNKQTGLLGSGVFELEVGDLPNGIHTVNVQLDNGSLSAPLCYLFYKQPLGGYGITRWEYWVNDDFDNRIKTNISPSIDTLEILSLLPVGHPAIRSNCFHFHPNSEEPYINAKNQISFRIWDVENRFLDKSAFFVDEQVQQNIVAQVFERNTTETFASPRNNQIQWFKVEAGIGDSLAFVADKACAMQLFAPSGEEVYSVTASEAMVFGGCHAWEDGTYYLAVHDVTGSGGMVSVTYQWINRYAVLTISTNAVGNGGYSSLTFQGNGFNSLSDVYLINAQNDTIRNFDIGHETNTKTSVTFDFMNKVLGEYDIVFVFYEEIVIFDNILQIEEPKDIYLTATASYPSSFISGTSVTYTFTVTNNGNESVYAIPIYLYITTPHLEDISHIELRGLELPSLFDYLNLNFDTISNMAEIREIVKEIGDDHYFYKDYVYDEELGINRGFRSNFFFIDLGPNETKTIKLKMNANPGGHELFEAWMTVPSDTLLPFNYYPYADGTSGTGGGSSSSGGSGGSGSGSGSGNGSGASGGGSGSGSSSGGSGIGSGSGSSSGGSDSGSGNSGDGSESGSGSGGYCCVQQQIQCTLESTCNGLDVADLFGFGSDLASCVCGVLENTNDVIGMMLCEGQGLGDALKSLLNKTSFYGTLISCASLHKPLGVLLKSTNKLFGTMTLTEMVGGSGSSSCHRAWSEKKPGCPDGDPVGGHSDPLTPGDPNDIYGYLSESGSHYMRQEIQNIHYEIEFENDTTLATAAAHTIIVCDTLDATRFDLNSLAAHSVTIGDKRLELNGEQTFARTLDMRPELYVIAQINQDYDPETGIVAWTIQSLDPMTMEPTDNPYQGVLPVNYFGDGVGFIDYSINLKQAFADGTEVSNRAGIIFDQEDIIMTPTWTNIVDAVKPTSHIEEVTPVADSLSFSFVSEDNRSGVWYHTLYYRNDSTYQEWQVRKAQIFEDSFMLHLEDLQTTEYLVMAVDSAGNREEKDMVAEYIFNSDDFDYSIFTTAGNWSTASNWQGGALPAADDVVFIEAPCQLDQNATVAALNVSNGQSLTLQSGNTLTVTGNLTNTVAANLVIEDGAQLVNASENVAATVKKDVTAYGIGNPSAWHTIASPVSGMSIAGSGFVTPEYDLYRYNETNLTGEEWENYKANLADFTTFEKGRGYLFANSNSFSPVFIGTLNNTDVTCSLTCTNRPNDPLSGFNLIGNPFPHNIYKGAGAAIDNANLASGYYTLTNEGTWQAHTFEDAILPGQGILVKATAPTVLTIVKSNLAATSESSEAERSKGSLSISIAGDNGQDQAYVYFGQGIGLDKVKSIALDAPSLAVRNGNGDFAIAHCDKKSDAVELVFTTPDEGSFTMDVNVIAGDFDYLHLIDLLTGVDVDLLATPSYTFKASARDDASRFRLVFSIKGN